MGCFSFSLLYYYTSHALPISYSLAILSSLLLFSTTGFSIEIRQAKTDTFLLLICLLQQWLILKIYTYVVIANVVISWLIAFNVLNTSNRFVYSVLEFTYKLTDPFLNRIRRFLPNLGAFDISPIVLLLLIWFIEMCMKLYVAPIIFS